MVNQIEKHPERVELAYKVNGQEEPHVVVAHTYENKSGLGFHTPADNVFALNTLHRILRSNQAMVNEFERMGSGDATLMERKPTIPTERLMNLRLKLLREETNELEGEFVNHNWAKESTAREALIGMLDAVCDIQYVLSGAILYFGFAGIFEEAFREVHRSNMTKFLTTEQEAVKEIAKFKEQNIECYYKEVQDKFVIFRLSDGKLLKPNSYSKANLEQFIP